MLNKVKMENINDIDEQRKAINCIIEIEQQKKMPTRNGMIQAIINSHNYASIEIRRMEEQKGEFDYVSFVNASDEQLYNKMLECQQAIYNHCFNKFGEEVAKSIFKARLQQ